MFDTDNHLEKIIEPVLPKAGEGAISHHPKEVALPILPAAIFIIPSWPKALTSHPDKSETKKVKHISLLVLK